MKKYIYVILSAFIFLNACTKDSGTKADPCTGISPKFNADVFPIMNVTCAINSTCHAAGTVNSGGELTDYNKIFARRSEIKFQLETGQMPKTGSISTDQKNKIICWINNGAPNN